MKESSLIIAIIFISLTATSAIADEQTPGFYVGGHGDGGSGYGAGANVGYDFGNVRTDLEYTYHEGERNSFHAGDIRIESHAFMGNVYANIPTDTIVKPYVGVGGGYAVVSPNGRGSQVTPAYQGMAGLDFTVDKQTTFYAGYKYFATSTPSKFQGNNADNYSVSYHTQSIEAGLRFKF